MMASTCALCEWREAQNASLRAEVETLRRERDELLAALKTIKKTVCGERIPNWESDWNTTHTRGIIADVCDIAIAKVKP